MQPPTAIMPACPPPLAVMGRADLRTSPVGKNVVDALVAAGKYYLLNSPVNHHPCAAASSARW